MAGGGLIPKTLPRNRLHFTDLARTATVGMRIRKLRSALSALGVMIGIAAMVGVLRLSKSELLAQLDRLGIADLLETQCIASGHR